MPQNLASATMAAQVCGLRPQIGEAWRRTEKFARNCRGKSEPWVCLDRPVWFARDSALEGDGFEPSVPPQEDGYFESAAEAGNDKPARYAATLAARTGF